MIATINNRIGLGAFGTFGEPFGYQQVFFLNAAFNSSLDLNTNAIEVYPGSELYAVKREIVNGVSAVSCCLYTYAREPNSNRGGTFIGACVVLNNSCVKGEFIYTLLRELHTDLTGNPRNIADHIIQVQKAEQLVVTEPASFAALQAKATTIPPAINHSPVDNRKKFLIRAPAISPAAEQDIAAFFEDAVTCFTDTDTLYFTTNKQIINHVAEKGLIAIADWEAFQGYKNQQQQQERAARRKAEAQRKPENPQPVKTQAPPAKVVGLYEQWTAAKPDKEAFKQMVDNHNTLLKEYLQLKNQQVPALPAFNNTTAHRYQSSSSFRIKKKHLLYAVIVLFVLLVITSCMLLFRSATASKEVAAAQTGNSIADSMVPVKNKPITDSLLPWPNTALTKTETVRLVTEKIKGKSLRKIVDAIFLKYPVAVATVYSWQKKEYAEYLMLKNKDCFKEDTAGYICTCDTLAFIPAFKK